MLNHNHQFKVLNQKHLLPDGAIKLFLHFLTQETGAFPFLYSQSL